MLALQIWQSQLLTSLNEKIDAVNQVRPYNKHYAEQEVKTHYWEWELDFEDPGASDIFDANAGFGGRSTIIPDVTEETLSSLNLDEICCVRDGRFKDLTPAWNMARPQPNVKAPLEFEPHCLRRCYTSNLVNYEAINGTWTDLAFSPQRIEELLSMTDFDEFNFALEDLHFWFPTSVWGDISSLLAPNEPLFYLHLTNVDRIWWKWQKRHQGAIDGLDDPLEFMSYPGMPDHPLRVKDVVETESDLLCYSYST
ncbi:hypothetical protein HBI37_005770 [Parastagonospora nodorum]|nr:hypothetical protein HBI37_005770 [Parastagonospora nodorum]KAH6369842.1 hypothetical protein HBI36_025470 [Parastagonospora nodorum]